MKSVILFCNYDMDICRVLINHTETIIYSNTHSTSGIAKIDIISGYGIEP